PVFMELIKSPKSKSSISVALMDFTRSPSFLANSARSFTFFGSELSIINVAILNSLLYKFTQNGPNSQPCLHPFTMHWLSPARKPSLKRYTRQETSPPTPGSRAYLRRRIPLLHPLHTTPVSARPMPRAPALRD